MSGIADNKEVLPIGHWIQECPTNSDPAYDNRPRIKRTTGIPKSFLMEVNRPAPKAGEEEEEDEDAVNGVKAGVMITADGGFVVARPDRYARSNDKGIECDESADFSMSSAVHPGSRIGRSPPTCPRATSRISRPPTPI